MSIFTSTHPTTFHLLRETDVSAKQMGPKTCQEGTANGQQRTLGVASGIHLVSLSEAGRGQGMCLGGQNKKRIQGLR